MNSVLNRTARLLACCLVVGQMLGCGGNDADPPPALVSVSVRESALAAPVGVDVLATTTKLLDFAERSFPDYFPDHVSDQRLNGWVYRYYGKTDVYIAVIDWRVYVMGGPFGPAVIDVGEVTQFVTATPLSNQPPIVSITSPIPGTYIAPATVPITATAADTNGSVVKVEFYSGVDKIGESFSAPYSFTWANVPSGTYSISAVATDNLGAKSTSTSVSVTVAPNKAPTVVLTGPSSGSTFTAPAVVGLTATATDDGSIAKVEFYAGTTKLGEDTASPFVYVWTNVPAGTYSLTARTTDTGGLTSVSNAVSVTVATGAPPTSPPGTLTASQLAQCPTVSGSSAQNYYLCMIGGLTGTQAFDSTKVCTLSISSSGVTSLSSDGKTYTITSDDKPSFSKASYLLVQLDSPSSLNPYTTLIIGSVIESGKSFFVDGGKLQVDASSSDYRTTPTTKSSLSCMFNVPKI